ncbi:MAG: YraN family protein [Candidatus Staskawiczbacteria bacterium]|nr:YraN family protein [Candidatus Staskawiczbacteria bacterium]
MAEEKIKRDLKDLNTRELGFLAEGIARHYLIKKGYKILAANYKMSFGEIDIVAQKDRTVVFAEVKANKDSAPEFSPEMRVDYKKKNKLINLATAYMLNQKMKDRDLDWQIDIISVIFDSENKKARIKHFKNAVNNY